jgi:hypothetical protein
MFAESTPIPVMKTGFSLCSFAVFISGIPANETRIFPVSENYTGKTLFWPCTGPVQDCSAGVAISKFSQHQMFEPNVQL